LTQTSIRRYPRFKRTKGEKPGFELQPRDCEIIKTVYDYRFLNSEQIKALVEGSNQVILRRLQKLFHHGYLDRPQQQALTVASGSKKIIYALGNNGADVLSEKYAIDRGEINWRTKNYEVKKSYIDHAMMISHFRVILTLALKGMLHTKLLFWDQGKELGDHVFVKDYREGKQRIPVFPDAFFGIEDPNGKMYFFLEADQSTMTNNRFLHKMRGYYHYWRQGRHTEKYRIKYFRVLSITKSRQRADNLRTITKQADERQKGFSAFWFTSEENFSLEEPGTVLKPIWQTPVNEGYHHLLE
jgi:hypothetical protein